MSAPGRLPAGAAATAAVPVLVTGGAGFLGRHLAARLAGAGRPVTVLDDLSCPNSNFECAPLAGERITKILGSVFDRPLVEELVAAHPVVVHFASVVGVEETVSRTIPTIENLNGTINVVRALGASQVAIFGSSADVYGAHSRVYDRPMQEDDLFVYENGRVNRWVYPHVKALEENLFANSAARTVAVRIFNSYGPEMDYPAPKRVVPHFIDCILARRPLLLSGDGSQRRSFCFVDDTVDGFVRAIEYASTGNAGHTSFNIGHPDPVTIRELARIMNDCACEIGLLDAPLPIVPNAFVYSRSFDDGWDRAPDITRAAQVLGFAPRTGLHEGLLRTLRYYRDLAAPIADGSSRIRPRGGPGHPAALPGVAA